VRVSQSISFLRRGPVWVGLVRATVVAALVVAALLGSSTAVASEWSLVPLADPTQLGVLVGRVHAAYVEPIPAARQRGMGARILFVGGPGLKGAPAIFLPAHPQGLLPPDLSNAKSLRLRFRNNVDFLVSIEIELRFGRGEYQRHAMISAHHWRNVVIDVQRLRDRGLDLSTFQGLALRPVSRHATQVVELSLEALTIEWSGPRPKLRAVHRRPARGPAASLPPDLRARGTIRWAGMKLPVVAEADVVVAGGGLAGVAAAVSAARLGATTILVERTGAVGGMATSGYVPPALRPDLAGGRVREFVERLERRGGPAQKTSHEVMKIVLLEMLRDSGAHLLLYTTAVAPILDGRVVRGIIIHSKAGFQAVRARVVVDCTGDADIAALAGAPFQVGRGRDKLTQAMTLMFLLGNVNTDEFCGPARGAVTTPYYQQAKRDGWWNIPFAGPAWCEVVVRGPHGVINVNCMNVGGVDGLSPADLTYAHVQAFDIAWQLVQFFRRYVPGCSDCYLVSTASLIGVRETRRIVGEYVLGARDVLACRAFPDGVARGFYPIDIHAADSTGDASGARPPGPYEIPYRCLVPKRAENILVAGRPISVDHVAHGSTRIQGTTMALGQAAGVAAALCCKLNVSPRKLDGRRVREELESLGAMPPVVERVDDNPALAANGTRVRVDSCHPRFPNSGPGAIDGIVAIGSGSRWVSGEQPVEHWIELHFPRAVTCRAVTLYFWPAGGTGDDPAYVPNSVEVQGRIDRQWVTLATLRHIDSVRARLEFEPATVRRLRIVFPNGGRRDWIIRLREVVVEEHKKSAGEPRSK